MVKTDKKLRDGSFAYLHDCSGCGLQNAYEARKGKTTGYCQDCLTAKRVEASKSASKDKRNYKAKTKLDKIIVTHGFTKDGFNFIFDYHEEGVITWKDTFGPKMQKGSIAGSWQVNGYKYVTISGKSLGCHRIIWEMHNGIIDEELVIDHIDRNPSNNRISNLRVVTPQQNTWNTESSGFVKVSDKYQARITKDGITYYLGTYTSPKEAAAAYKGAKSVLHIIWEHYPNSSQKDIYMTQYLLKAIATRDIRELTYGKEYITLKGIEEGIFENRPFVTVVGDDGKNFSCHLSRFEVIKRIE